MHVFSLDVFISFVHSRSVSKFTGKTFDHRNGVKAVYIWFSITLSANILIFNFSCFLKQLPPFPCRFNFCINLCFNTWLMYSKTCPIPVKNVRDKLIEMTPLSSLLSAIISHSCMKTLYLIFRYILYLTAITVHCSLFFSLAQTNVVWCDMSLSANNYFPNYISLDR